MRRIGLFGISLPEEFDGLGLTQEQQVLLTFEFTQASCVYRSRFSTTIGLCSQMILDYGTKNQKDYYLQEWLVGGYGRVRVNRAKHGSDAANLETHAVKDGNGYVINGIKRCITNA